MTGATLREKVAFGLSLWLVLFVSAAARADAVDGHFDGAWSTTLSCTVALGALPYLYQFITHVENGVLHGEKGVKGTPGWLEFDGKVLPDGSARIHASGLVGSSSHALEHRPPGTPYDYRIMAKFSEASGTGNRVGGRSCTVSFTKMN